MPTIDPIVTRGQARTWKDLSHLVGQRMIWLRHMDRYLHIDLPDLLRDQPLCTRQRALVTLVLMAADLTGAFALLTQFRFRRALNVLYRALWEHQLDFESIRRSTGDAAARQFFAFASVQQWNHHKALSRALAELGRPIADEAHAFLSQQKAADLAAVIKETWPTLHDPSPARVRSWDLLSIRQRAVSLGPEYHLSYLSDYSSLSWSVHSGIIDKALSVMPHTEYEDASATILDFSRALFDLVSKLLVDLGRWDSERERILVDCDEVARAETVRRVMRQLEEHKDPGIATSIDCTTDILASQMEIDLYQALFARFGSRGTLYEWAVARWPTISDQESWDVELLLIPTDRFKQLVQEVVALAEQRCTDGGTIRVKCESRLSANVLRQAVQLALDEKFGRQAAERDWIAFCQEMTAEGWFLGVGRKDGNADDDGGASA